MLRGNYSKSSREARRFSVTRGGGRWEGRDGVYCSFFFFFNSKRIKLPGFFAPSLPLAAQNCLAKLKVLHQNLRLWPPAGPEDPAAQTHPRAHAHARTQKWHRPPRARSHGHPPRSARAVLSRLTLSQTLTPGSWPRVSAGISWRTAGPVLCGRPC